MKFTEVIKELLVGNLKRLEKCDLSHKHVTWHVLWNVHNTTHWQGLLLLKPFQMFEVFFQCNKLSFYTLSIGLLQAEQNTDKVFLERSRITTLPEISKPALQLQGVQKGSG